MTTLTTEECTWIATKDRLPEAGHMVLFVLSGNRIPRAGFFDTVDTYCDRTEKWDEKDAIESKDWWTDANNDIDWWDSDYVTHWCEIPEVPA